MNLSSTQGTARLTRESDANLDIITLDLGNRQEFFLTARQAPEETPAAMFARAASALREREAAVVSQEVIGISREDGGQAALEEAFGELAWPVTWLVDGVGSTPPLAGTQVWAVSGAEVETMMAGDCPIGRRFEDDAAVYCRLGGLVPGNADDSRAGQARQIFALMNEGIQAESMDFSSHVLRTWFYNEDILDWYGDFNEVRHAFFYEHNVFDGLVPASTGIGAQNADGAALTGGLLAVKPKAGGIDAQAVPSPLQCPALEYGSGFSRAAELSMPGHRRLFISGTASIAESGETQFLDDVDKQIERTLEVAGAILESRAMGWENVVQALVYLKPGVSSESYVAFCERTGFPALPFVFVRSDVCRHDLLFEVELLAVATR